VRANVVLFGRTQNWPCFFDFNFSPMNSGTDLTDSVSKTDHIYMKHLNEFTLETLISSSKIVPSIVGNYVQLFYFSPFPSPSSIFP